MKVWTFIVALPAAMAFAAPAVAQKDIIAGEYMSAARPPQIEVTPNVMVSRHIYRVNDNEAPFFNFQTARALPPEDEDYVTTVLEQVPDRAEAARMVGASAWRSLLIGKDLEAAGRRLNQAFLIDARESIVYHGYAALVSERFQDYSFADELMRIAARMNAPASTLNADHGRILLLADRPKDARPYLEKGIRDEPDWAVPRANLAIAVYLSGNPKEACRLIRDVRGREREAMDRDLEMLRARAKC
jgi:Flp pilus assembly protein TadD